MRQPIALSNPIMSSATLIAPPAEPPEAEKSALHNLLADEDQAVHEAVRARILSYGQGAVKWVRPWTLSPDALLRRRSLEIVQHLSRQENDNDFIAFCLNHGEELDLERGAFLLARTQFPDVNIEAYSALLDSYATDLRLAMPSDPTAEAAIATVNHFLFSQLGYAGNEQKYYDPLNSYLNCVMDRRSGNPLSLSTIYLLVGRRLHLPLVGIGMPGHFLCRYQSSTEEHFIDPFNRGKLLSKADCVKYLRHTHDGFKESYLAPVNPRRMLLRMCSNLHQIYTQMNLAEETARFQRYIVALAQ